MGSGKTSAGEHLAQDFGLNFLDTDYHIEQETGQSIADIFAKQGEPYFRKLETTLLKQMQPLQNTVVASGGGMLEMAGNMSLIQALGCIIYLQASPTVLVQRLSKSQQIRPLLPNPVTKVWVEEFLKRREIFYQQAQYTLEVGISTIQEVAQNVGQWIRENEII